MPSTGLPAPCSCFTLLCLQLSHLDKKKGVDYTHYGENSTKSFYTHHMNAISVACVTGEAEAINWAISRAETRFSGETV